MITMAKEFRGQMSGQYDTEVIAHYHHLHFTHIMYRMWSNKYILYSTYKY